MFAALPGEAGAMPPDQPAPQISLDRFGSGSTELHSDLNRFVTILGRWQRTHNLVASSAMMELWDRHILDSLQLLAHAPDFREWVDLGSGAGFPGLVVALACKSKADRHVTLVESTQKKAAFLRAAIRETGVNATVAAERIEQHGPRMRGKADVVSARALAPLPRLCTLAAPYLHQGSVMLLLKGQDFVQEIAEASKAWDFDVIDSPSATDPGGRVLAIRGLSPKVPRT